MEFKVYQKELELQSRGWIPTFHDVSKEIMEIVKASGVKNGTVCIASHHTTCSVMIQECSHDLDSFDLEYLQHDLLDIMRKLIPDYTNEGDYRHPGPVHAQFGRYVNEPGNYTCGNGVGFAVACDCEGSVAVLIVLRLLVDADRTCFQLVDEVCGYCKVYCTACERYILRFRCFISGFYVDFADGVGDCFLGREVINGKS